MTSTRILGIDPGLNRTGWGVVDSAGNRLSHIAHGVITSDPADSLAARLAALYAGLVKVTAEFSPDEAAVEEVFVNKNPSSTLKLGMARGVALLVPANTGLPVAEYAANLVKKSIVGAGHADKSQVAMMVSRLLPGTNATADAADALAVAICHAHHRSKVSLIQPLIPTGRVTSRSVSIGTITPSPSQAPARPLFPLPAGERVTAKPAGEGGYRPKPGATQIARARQLRRDSTDVESLLWNRLRADQLGAKFRRQVPVLGYIADFLSHEARLVVELDGGQHATQDAADARRTQVLEQAGFRVLRFWNNEINDNLDGVLQTIVSAIAPSPAGSASTLSPEGRGNKS